MARHPACPPWIAQSAAPVSAILALLALTVSGPLGCGDDVGPSPDTEKGVRYPLKLTPVPGGRTVLVAGANFDRRYRAGKLRALDTATERFVAMALEIPAFVGDVALQLPESASADALPLRLIVTSRETDEISLPELVPGSPSLPFVLQCGEHDRDGRCDTAHRYPSPLAGAAAQPPPIDMLGADPMGVEVLRWGPANWRVTVVAAADGQVTVLKLNQAGQVKAIDVANFGAGLTAVRTVPATGRTYISDARSPALHVFRLDPAPSATQGYKLAPEPAINLPSAVVRDFGRGLALSGNGGRLYLADRSPASLVVIDVAPDSAGVPRNKVVQVLPLGGQPSEVSVAPTGADGRELVYISCFNDDSVWVVDPQLHEVVAKIRLPHAAYGLAIQNVAGLHPATGQPRGWMLYAALFNKHAVVAVPIAPAALDRHVVRLIAEAP